MKSQSVFKNVFLLVMASVLIYAFTKPYAPTPALKWDKMAFDFGEIQQGIPAEAVFNLTNVSQEPLLIKKVKGSCGCTATNYTQEPVSPGESAEISATYNAKNLGVFKKTVTVYTNFDEKPTVLTLSGKVVTP